MGDDNNGDVPGGCHNDLQPSSEAEPYGTEATGTFQWPGRFKDRASRLSLSALAPKPLPDMRRRRTRSMKWGNPTNKYNAKRTYFAGHTFDSKKECRRFAELTLLQRSGAIAELELQPRFTIAVNGVRVCAYVADFRYLDVANGTRVVEDVKSPATERSPVFRLKRRLLAAVHGVVVRTV